MLFLSFVTVKHGHIWQGAHMSTYFPTVAPQDLEKNRLLLNALFVSFHYSSVAGNCTQDRKVCEFTLKMISHIYFDNSGISFIVEESSTRDCDTEGAREGKLVENTEEIFTSIETL
jgi:hypothetical protein